MLCTATATFCCKLPYQPLFLNFFSDEFQIFGLSLAKLDKIMQCNSVIICQKIEVLNAVTTIHLQCSPLDVDTRFEITRKHATKLEKQLLHSILGD